MGEVHCAIERIDDPGWTILDDIFLRGAFGIRLFPKKGVLRVPALDFGVNECFDICCE